MDHQLPEAPPPEDRPPLKPPEEEDELIPLDRRPEPELLVCTFGIETFSLTSWPQFLQLWSSWAMPMLTVLAGVTTWRVVSRVW